MTPKQLELYDFIKEYRAKHRMAPTYRQMMDAIGSKSPNTPYNMVGLMVEEGVLKKTKGRARSVDIARNV